jgi:arginase family enzyme
LADFLRPAHAAATGTPEPGGPTARALALLWFSLVLVVAFSSYVSAK